MIGQTISEMESSSFSYLLSLFKRIIPRILTTALFLNFAIAKTPNDTKAVDISVEIDSFLKEQAAKGFSGSVLVARDGKILFKKSIGFPGSDALPLFWLASNSKQFTAAAILRLQEQEKLSVKDPITKFLHDVPPDKQNITIHHLLSHTSGFASSYVAEGIADRDEAARSILAGC